MTIQALSDADISAVYTTCMIHDFPDDERKPLAMIQKALSRGEYLCLGLYDAEILRGYAFFVQLGTEYLLDYYAILPQYRCMQYGSRFLALLREQFHGAEAVLIETENPDFSAPGDATPLRRLRFYRNAGCRQTGVTANIFGVEYRILELFDSAHHTDAMIREIYTRLYRSFLPPEWFRQHFCLH